MTPRYDRLFWGLLALLVLASYPFLRDAVRAIIADAVSLVHGVTNAVAYEPETEAERLGLAAMVLIAFLGLLRLLLRRRDTRPEE